MQNNTRRTTRLLLMFCLAGLLGLAGRSASADGIASAYFVQASLEGEPFSAIVIADADESDFTVQEGQDLVDVLRTGVTLLLGGISEPVTFMSWGPQDLAPAGLDDADAAHAFVLSNLNLVDFYLRMQVTKRAENISTPTGGTSTSDNIRVDVYSYGFPLENQFFYVASLSIAEETVDLIALFL